MKENYEIQIVRYFTLNFELFVVGLIGEED